MTPVSQSVPRRCRWFGHKWHWPPRVAGIVFFEGTEHEFFAATGGFDFTCERCPATSHAASDVVATGRIY